MDIFNKSYEKYQKTIVKIGFLSACLVAAVEIFMFVFYATSASVPASTAPPAIFFVKFFLIPSLVNFTVVIATHFFIKSPRYTISHKNYAVMIMLTVLGSCIQIAHHVFVLVFSTLILVMFVSAIFQNIRITTIIYVISYFNLFIIVFLIKTYQGEDFPFLWQNILVTALLLYISFVLTRVLINIQTEREQLVAKSNQETQELKQQLMLDPLTNLYNCEAFFDLLKAKCIEFSLKPNDLQLAIVDVDDFTKVISTYGYLNSNNVILKVAQLLCNHMPDNAVVSRYDSKRFAVLFSKCTSKQAEEWLETARFLLQDNTVVLSNEQVKVTFSSGLTAYQPDLTHEAFFENASRALYDAKANGKNQTVVL